jgi:hypothetical protein
VATSGEFGSGVVALGKLDGGVAASSKLSSGAILTMEAVGLIVNSV